MNLKDVLKECPKAAEKYYAFAGEGLKKLQQLFASQVPGNMESTLPDIDEVISREYGNSILDTNPRSLYDFFDKQETLISIGYDEDYSWFYYSIWTGEAFHGAENTGIDRNIVEQNAFTKAFQLLEEKLNNNN